MSICRRARVHACACRLGCLSPQILSILLYLEHFEGWLLQTFGWPLVCVAVWHPPRSDACNRRAPLIPLLDPFKRGLSSAPVVCLCLLSAAGPGPIPLADQSHSVHSSCHHFLSLSFLFFIFQGFHLVGVLRSLFWLFCFVVLFYF